MASVYRRKEWFNKRTGRPCKKTDPDKVRRIADYWTGSYLGADGLWHKKDLGTDKAEALRIANHLENEAKKRLEGLVDQKTDALAAAENRALAEHLADYELDLKARGSTEKHVRLTVQRIENVIQLSKARRISELKAATVTEAIGSLRKDGYSESSCGHYLRAAKLFSRWLLREGRAREDVLTVLRVKVVQRSERIRNRRALNRDEFTWLIQNVAKSSTAWGMSGTDRATAYQLAAMTGFRSGELRSLNLESFDLDAEEPGIVVQAGYSKRRRDDR